MKVARLKGLEPPAHCLEGSCSIQLSYRRNFTASAKARELLYPKKRFCQHKIRGLFNLVRERGLEPLRHGHKILSLARLPIPPFPHAFWLEEFYIAILFYARRKIAVASAQGDASLAGRSLHSANSYR